MDVTNYRRCFLVLSLVWKLPREALGLRSAKVAEEYEGQRIATSHSHVRTFIASGSFGSSILETAQEALPSWARTLEDHPLRVVMIGAPCCLVFFAIMLNFARGRPAFLAKQKLQAASGATLSDASGSDGEATTRSSTGGCASMSEENSDQAEAARFQARMRFFFVTLVATCVPMLFGIIVYPETNSLTVEMDTINALLDLVSVLLNMGVEVFKHRATDKTIILKLDMLGCGSSLMLLVSAGIFGLMRAVPRAEVPTAPASHVGHFGLMVAYNLVGLLCGAMTSLFWLLTHHEMEEARSADGRGDELNVLSSLMHLLVALAMDVTVFLTSMWMMYVTQKGEVGGKLDVDAAEGDVVGSVVLCTCILLSAAILVKESIQTHNSLQEPCSQAASKEASLKWEEPVQKHAEVIKT
eukprot:TRINITY_DN121811_c0_g1_i1.p1 TRINITY_DN121811_c0_g1~~TRINITY_DN121811_c0_g1_i1.p1  ORF type:complete len:412 (+),score=72.55 TRINITY_DN121811_c0_g1_i1:132-1367(+)